MPLDSYTSSLLHFDGADGSTSIIDETGKTWTCGSGHSIDTAEYKFGRSSLLGSTSYSTTTPDHDDFDVGSGDFTIDLWVKRSSLVTGYLFNKTSQIYMSFNASNQVELWGCGATLTSSPYTVSTSWTHVAVMRSGSSKYIYINGTKCNSGSAAGTVARSSNVAVLGAMSGWTDEFRFSKGVVRWDISGFVAPTAPYSNGDFIPRVMMIGE